jgi:hypothetical protein
LVLSTGSRYKGHSYFSHIKNKQACLLFILANAAQKEVSLVFNKALKEQKKKVFWGAAPACFNRLRETNVWAAFTPDEQTK